MVVVCALRVLYCCVFAGFDMVYWYLQLLPTGCLLVVIKLLVGVYSRLLFSFSAGL